MLFSLCVITTLLLTDISAFSQDKEIADTLREAVVSADYEFGGNHGGLGLKHIDTKLLNKSYSFFSTPDILKLVQMFPGVATGTELLSGIYVHGGTGDDNLFLLDGVPLFQVSHFGGIFSAFNTDIIKTACFYKSGFPAKFGGRVSSVLDISTDDGDMKEYRGLFSIGIIDGRLKYSGPIIKNKMSFNIALRRSWIDLISTPILKIYNKGKINHTFGTYNFYDFNTNICYKNDHKDEFSLKIYSGFDYLNYNDYSKKKVYGIEISYEESESILKTRWGNFASSLNWKHIFSDKVLSYTKIFYSSGQSNVKESLSHKEILKKKVLSDSESNKILGNIHNIGLSTNFNFHYKRISFNAGGIYQIKLYLPENHIEFSDNGKISTYSPSERKKYLTNEIAAYISASTVIGNTELTTGMRLSAYQEGKKLYFMPQPRIVANLHLSDKITLTSSYSYMVQFNHLVSSLYLDLPTNLWMPSTEKIRPLSSHQITLGGNYRFSPKLKTSIGGYFKNLDNCLIYIGAPTFFIPLEGWEDNLTSGKGLGYGAEFEIEYNSDKLRLDCYYTLSWSKRLYKRLYSEWFRDRFDNRHKITISAIYKINSHWDMNIVWNYHSGNRVTLPVQVLSLPNKKETVLFSEPYNAKMPDYHRLDFGINNRKKIHRGQYERIWNLSIYNAYCRLNPFAMGFEYMSHTDKRLVAEVKAIIPIIPTIGYTLKF